MGREPCSSMKTCFRMAGAPAPLKVAMHSVFPRSMLNYHRFQTDNIASFFKGQRIENPDAYLMCVQAGESAPCRVSQVKHGDQQPDDSVAQAKATFGPSWGPVLYNGAPPHSIHP